MFAFNIRGRPWEEIPLSAIFLLLLLPFSASGRSALTDSTDLKIKNATPQDATGVENSIFIHPTDSRIVLEAHMHVGGVSGWVSQDGGKTWAGVDSTVGGPEGSGDPAAVIQRNEDGSGTRYFVAQLIGESDSLVGGVRAISKDSPTSLTWAPKTVYNGQAGQSDKPHLWANNNTSGTGHGDLYAAWSIMGADVVDHVQVKRSIDDGDSWTDLENIDVGGHSEWGVNLKVGISEANRGNVYAVWGETVVSENCRERIDNIYFNKSTNRGVDWGTPVLVRNLDGKGYQVRDRLWAQHMGANSAPSMAVDGTGNIYVVWCQERRGGTQATIYMAKSTNEGVAWSDTVRIVQDISSKWHPWITWDDCTNTLAVVFFDHRLGSTNTYVAHSQNGGTWYDFKVSDTGWSGKDTTNAFAGDYIGIAARDGIAYPVWSDDRDVKWTFKPYVSPFYLWGVDQSSVSDSIVGLSADSIRVTASWSTNLAATAGDYITLYQPGGGTPITSPSCTSCGSTSHTMSFTARCQKPGSWDYTVKSTRSGCSARGSDKKSFYLWGVYQDSTLSASIVGIPEDSITVTASWTTSDSAASGDYIVLRLVPDESPENPITQTSPTCTDCAGTDGKTHEMSFTVLCGAGYWYYTVKSTRPGSPARGSDEKVLQKVSNCIE